MPVNKFLTLSDNFVLKQLEKPSLFHPGTDELFELSRTAFDFLKKCASLNPPRPAARTGAFVKFCLREKILKIAGQPRPRKFSLKKSPRPSLRYLLVHLTDACNLQCRHCYLGEPQKKFMPWATLKKILKEFEEIQGLRLLISGGEPLLHPDFWRFNRLLPQFNFRKILLTNGLLLNEKNIPSLKFDEIQVSLDGLKKGHETLRGQNTFEKTRGVIKLLKKSGLNVSVSTMIHRQNLTEFPGLKKIIKNLRVDSWTVDIPYGIGRLKEAPALTVTPKTAAHFLNFSFGPEGHNIYGHYACGTHLMAIMADGRTDQCGYFLSAQSPPVKIGLKKCFQKIKRIPLKKLKCAGCRFIIECRGGCRARATGPFDRDPYMCYHNYGGDQK